MSTHEPFPQMSVMHSGLWMKSLLRVSHTYWDTVVLAEIKGAEAEKEV